MVEHQYCSWCFKKTIHLLIERNYLSRNEYQCSDCGNFTVQCRYCKNMAKGKPANPANMLESETLWDNSFELGAELSESEERDSIWTKLKNAPKNWADHWNSELCAEHDGAIANFERLSEKLEDLADYQSMFNRNAVNLMKIGKLMAGMVGGAAVFCPLTYLAAPGVAAALGSLGLLGATAAGTAISSLSGAALVNASLAATGLGSIAAGGFGMAGGMFVISAAGAALGGIQGAVVSNAYFGAIKGFKIEKIQTGTGPALIFINGFLSEKDQDFSDWVAGVSRRFPHNPYYCLHWEAENLYKIGQYLSVGAAKKGIDVTMSQLMQQGAKSFSTKVLPLGAANLLADLLKNPWHSAMAKASMAGVLLADLLARTHAAEGFILMGNSLGCRVVYTALNALATKKTNCVKDVYLLGGAVSSNDADGWKTAIKAITGNMYNFYSLNDGVLKYLYRLGTGMISTPAGRSPIAIDHPRLTNYDATQLVDGHMQYKLNLTSILEMMGTVG